MNKLTEQEILQLLYGTQKKKDVPNWETLHEFDSTSANKAFDAKVYKKGNRIVLSLAGTYPESKNDWLNDGAVVRGKIPSQYGDAERLYNAVKQQYPDAQIETTGYSLGGTISNLLSHRTGIPSYAVAPIGSKHIANKNTDYFKYDDSNINTYGRRGDDLFYKNINKQSGNVHIIPDLPKDQFYKYDIAPQHMLHNYNPYDLYKSKLYKKQGTPTGFAADHIFTPSEIGSMSDEDFEHHEHTISQQATRGLIQPQSHQRKDFSGWKNPFNNDNRIFTRESIGEMSDNEFESNEKAIGAQLNKIGIPTNNEMQNSFGAVYVAPYTRADGVQVKGYYRSR